MREGKLAEEEEGKGGLSSLAEEIPGPNHTEFGFFFFFQKRRTKHECDKLRFVFRNKIPGDLLGAWWQFRQEVERPDPSKRSLSTNTLSVSHLFPLSRHQRGTWGRFFTKGNQFCKLLNTLFLLEVTFFFP